MGEDRIEAGDIARAALGLIPETPRLLRAGLALAQLRPEAENSIGLLLEQRARATPWHTALVFEGERWSYHAFNAWANRIARALRAAGARRGDTVAILSENRPSMLACVAAVAKIGAVAGMLNPNQRGAVLRHSIDLISPRLLVVGDDCVPALRSALPRIPRRLGVLWDGEGAAPRGMKGLRALATAQRSSDPASTRGVKLADPFCFIFTSGTTGLPKAAVMSHLRWMRVGYVMGQGAMRLDADDVFYCALPFYHNSALTVCWSAVLAAGATLVMARKFSASRFWEEIRASGATAFVYIGEFCRYLLAQPSAPGDRGHAVRVMVGNGLRPEIWDEFQQRFGVAHVCEFYGSSEGSLGFVNTLGLPRTAGFCPLPYAIVAYDAEREEPLRDARGRLRRVPPGETGLLLMPVSRFTPFDGYTDATATGARLLHDVFRRGDTWFDSGDLVREQGFRHIAFVDRVGDTFRWKGENVATTEVERALAKVPGVAEAAVYGVPVPRADGRAGMAAIVPAAGQRVDVQAAAAVLASELPAYAVPRFLRLVKAYETTATFKVRKVALKQQGFDPGVVSDPLYVLVERARGYEKLTPRLYARIRSGELRLP
jgi:acyl-CoA synthetase (AMP-forming)/AMP-acid ligase II